MEESGNTRHLGFVSRLGAKTRNKDRVMYTLSMGARRAGTAHRAGTVFRSCFRRRKPDASLSRRKGAESAGGASRCLSYRASCLSQTKSDSGMFLRSSFQSLPGRRFYTPGASTMPEPKATAVRSAAPEGRSLICFYCSSILLSKAGSRGKNQGNPNCSGILALFLFCRFSVSDLR